LVKFVAGGKIMLTNRCIMDSSKRMVFYTFLIILTGYSCKTKTTSPAKEKISGSSAGAPVNFVSAAKLVTPGVVHVKTVYQYPTSASTFLGRYPQNSAPAAGSGSGVVISADGFIATNNHVIENASMIEVMFPDRRSYPARLVGRDPNTDLALLKVEAKDLLFVPFGNSDNVQVGEWVLAIGYPLSLNTTVTAGIVSAKGRSIGIINSSDRPAYFEGSRLNSAVESFIQTDAAINPGNSGGALVNLDGQLIGINTAIASVTGSFTGYAFAVPVNLAKKILDDLREFGKVKRGLLGVSFPSPADEIQALREQGINPGSVQGVLITGIQEGSAAAEAGLQEADIIQRVNGVEIFSSAEFSERIARQRPGNKIMLDYLRDGSPGKTEATLKGEESLVTLSDDSEALKIIYEKLGAKFSPLSNEMQDRYNLNAGVVLTDVSEDGLFARLGILPGTIIAYINGRAINHPQDIDQALMDAQNSRIQILGIAPDGSRIAFNFSLGA
jgi:serine protease Do